MKKIEAKLIQHVVLGIILFAFILLGVMAVFPKKAVDTTFKQKTTSTTIKANPEKEIPIVNIPIPIYYIREKEVTKEITPEKEAAPVEAPQPQPEPQKPLLDSIIDSLL